MALVDWASVFDRDWCLDHFLDRIRLYQWRHVALVFVLFVGAFCVTCDVRYKISQKFYS